jgi:hypothetical protein
MIAIQRRQAPSKEPVQAAAPAGARPDVMQGSTLGFGLREAGERPR